MFPGLKTRISLNSNVDGLSIALVLCAVFNRSRFENNRAGFIGGGIHNFNVTTTVLKGNVFIDNHAAMGSRIANTLNTRVTMIANSVDPDTVFTDDASSIAIE